MKDLQVPCIVCGAYITWDDSPLPAACATHSYQEVFEAYDEAAEQGLHSDAGKSADLQAVSNASAESTSQAVA